MEATRKAQDRNYCCNSLIDPTQDMDVMELNDEEHVITFCESVEVLLYLYDALPPDPQYLVAHPPLALLAVHLRPVAVLVDVVVPHGVDLPLPRRQPHHQDLAAVVQGQLSVWGNQ